MALSLSMLLGSTLWAGGAEELWITNNVAETAAARLEGRGIAFGARASGRALDVHGREIVWREDHRVTDERSGTHVFYRQYLVDGRINAELVGSEVGVHYDADGRLDFVNGTQFADVMIANDPEIDGIDAARRAHHAARSFARADGDAIVARAGGARDGKLQIMNVDGELRFVWRVPVSHGGHEPQDVVIDAQNERVVSSFAHSRHNNCFPDQTAVVSARGKAVRNGIAERILGATTAIPFRAPRVGYAGAPVYSHEGFWNVSPMLAVHQQLATATDQQQWQCDNPQNGYSLMALNTNASGQPYYDDNGIFHARAGGDAMYHTRQTMLAFSTMGRNSWDGAGAPATVVIDSYASFAATDFATFRPTPRNSYDPPGASVGIARAANYYNMAASLDVLGHEWGHGVIYTHPRFPRSTDGVIRVSDQLDEGFADVIGNIVEKLRQPAESGTPDPKGRASTLERSSDWTIHEDSSGTFEGYLAYARGAVDDGADGHVWVGNNNYTPAATQDRLHFADPDNPTDTAPHTAGNMLVVVLRLLTEGGYNPLCDRNPDPVPCNYVQPLGFTRARKIMWNTLPNLTFGTSTWEQVANAAVRAAYSQFKMCNASPIYIPVFEQEQTKAAFNAIGLTVTEPIRSSCQ